MDKQVTEEKNIEEVLESQKELHEARDSFQRRDIIHKDVLEFKKKSGSYKLYDELYGTDSVFDFGSYRDILSFSYTGSIYVPVIFLDYGDEDKPFVCGVFTSESQANDYIRDIDKNNFRFRINEDNITHNTRGNKFYEFFDSDYIRRYAQAPKGLVYVSVMFFSMILHTIMLPETLAYETFSDFSNIELIGLLMVFVLPLLAIGVQSLFNKIDDVFRDYEIIDLDINFTSMNEEETDYKSVEVSIEVDDSGLEMYSSDLDCRWFYEKKENGLIEEEGVSLVDNIPLQGNSTVITVRDSGYSDSPLMSEDGEWWIDLND